MMMPLVGPLRHRKRISNENAVSRNVFIYHMEDQGVEAVRLGVVPRWAVDERADELQPES
jgi:hypothetical protein